MVILFAASALATPCEDTLDLLGRGVPEPSVADVVRSDDWDAIGVDCLVRAGAPRTVVVAAARTASLAPPPDGRRRRWELAVGSGWIPNPGIATVATVDTSLTWFPADLLGIAVNGTFGVQPPRVSRKPITRQILDHPPTQPRDQLGVLGALSLVFVPLNGELHSRDRTFDLSGFVVAGTGWVGTADDPDIFWQEDPAFQATAVEAHPALLLGGGFRVAFSPALGLRFQVDQARWVEVYEATTTRTNHRESLSAAVTIRPARR